MTEHLEVPIAGAALLRPVRAGNAFEETVERVLQAIRLGVLGPGDRLPAERELAARLAVSRATLREALHALAEAGYVESRRGRYGGTFVTGTEPETGAAEQQGTEDSVEDVLVLRGVLEPGAAAAAAETELTEQAREHLRSQLSASSGSALEEYRRKDSRLHLAIAEVTGSASLTAAVADVRSRVNGLLDRIPLLEPNLAHSDEQHERVVGAILDGDPEAARVAMAEHLAGTAALLRGFLSGT
ncbi:FadR/GntR family transcriptional regulator [Sciscionella sediminilitoris]|uniref:FadR/GntR family transcriptional regulator n=1 Tax=Sciscionella sediminilitoris TaxID=1445613 RepID=UPI00068BCD88|nr:GntR family transcriptional regulator [Sciscionella sp. SE31]